MAAWVDEYVRGGRAWPHTAYACAYASALGGIDVVLPGYEYTVTDDRNSRK